jgi:hypothetical protein
MFADLPWPNFRETWPTSLLSSRALFALDDNDSARPVYQPTVLLSEIYQP